MPSIYVAMSETQQTWAADVGLTRNVFKLGLSEATGEAAVEALNESRHAGRSDWKLLAEQDAGDAVEAELLARAARKETLIDPTYYPQIKRAPGIFKVKLASAENHFLVKDALEGKLAKPGKLKPQQIATYLIRAALG